MSELALEAEGLGKCYRIFRGPSGRLLELATLGMKPCHEEFWALRGVDLSVRAGSVLGVCGANGAGKSTLLKILTETTTPSEGRFRTHGRVRSLLELGVGFRWELSGRENLRDHLILMGTRPRDMSRYLEEVIEFSELGDFIDRALKTYSSGMAMRLGFSIAAVLDPDLLILDEVFAVGDIAFQKKCIDRIHGFKQSGKTVILCSHSIYDLRHFCDEVVWLSGGHVAGMGEPVSITGLYAAEHRSSGGERDSRPEESSSVEDSPRIVSLTVVRPGTRDVLHEMDTGETIEFRIEWERPPGYAGDLNVGAGLVRADSVVSFGLATHFTTGVRLTGRAGVLRLRLPELKVLSGRYTVAAHLMDANGQHRIHECVSDHELLVRASTSEMGMFLPEYEWIIEEPT